MELVTTPVALRGTGQARSARGSTGDAITARPDPFATRTMTRASPDVHPCTTSSAIAVAYRFAPDRRVPS